MKIYQKTFLAGSAVLLMLAARSSAALIAEDAFLTGSTPAAGEYTLGSVSGQGPATTGFTGNWIQGSGGYPEVLASGLSYSDGSNVMQTDGGSLKAEASSFRSGRLLSAGFDDTTSGTYYLGFLYQQASTAEGYRSVYLADSDVNDKQIYLSIDGTNAGQLNFSVNGNTTTNVAASNTDVNFFLLKFDLSDTAASDSLSLFMNPSLSTVPDAGSAIYSDSGLDLSVNYFGLERFVSSVTGKDRDFTVDEFRISQNYADVTTIPEPGSLVLLGMGLSAIVCLGKFRRG